MSVCNIFIVKLSDTRNITNFTILNLQIDMSSIIKKKKKKLKKKKNSNIHIYLVVEIQPSYLLLH